MAYQKFDPAIAARKQRNVEIFNETLSVIRSGEYTAPSGKKVKLPSMDAMLAGEECHHAELPKAQAPEVEGGTRIMVELNDCMATALRLVGEGYHPAMLNFASAGHPGGGVTTGARAQEESICRRGTLVRSIYSFSAYSANMFGFDCKPGNGYPLDNLRYSIIYSPEVTFFREGLDCTFMEQPYQCAVITCAALNLNGRYSIGLTADGHMPDEAKEITSHKVRAILRLGLLKGHDSLVLGAFGCGAFKNPPLEVAQIFKSVLAEPEFKNRFRLVTFSIIEDHNSNNANFNAFKQVFEQN